jgi:protein O-GlcNAc transferase
MMVLMGDEQNLAHWSMLGESCFREGRYQEAIAAFQNALRLEPHQPRWHYLLGCAWHELQDRPTAISAYQRALQLKPGDPDVANNLAIAYQELGQIDQAISAYEIAIRSRPEFSAAWTNYGIALQARDRFAEARTAFQRSLQFDPTNTPTWLALGSLCLASNAAEEAIRCFEQAIAYQPNNADAYYNLGLACQSLDLILKAADAYRRAAELSPRFTRFLYLSQAIDLGCTRELEIQTRLALDEMLKKQQQGIVNPVSPYLVLIAPVEATAEEQYATARYWSDQTYRFVPRLKLPKRAMKSKIRLGYISPDFRGHPGSALVAELLETHHRDRFEVYAYSLAPPDTTVFRQRIIRGCDRFIELRGLSIGAAAEKILADEIDILVDISGYTQHSRTAILATHPASLQVNYLGYPGTMGADFMDYILVDDFIVPEVQSQYFSEKLVYLPGCYQVNTSHWKVAEPVSREASGLPQDAFVMCCFNNPYKITHRMLNIWLRVLQKVPNSVLWLLETPEPTKQQLLKQAAAFDIASSRIIFAPKQPLSEHLSRHRAADIFVDCYPVNAHTTASDALRMGLPLVTLCGQTMVSRVAGSLLKTVGLSELIADSDEQYEKLILRLAHEPDYLCSLKHRLSENIRTSSLFNIQASTAKIEAAYQIMHQQFLRNEAPKSFRVTA